MGDFPAYFLFNKNKVRMPAIGTIDELDQIAKKFMKDNFAEEHLKAASALAEGQYSTDRKAPMYVKIMQKIKEKGEEYIPIETSRVTKLLQGKLTSEKKSELEDKMKILTVIGA